MEKTSVNFDYFYERNAEQYAFYRVPKILFSSEYFRKLSCEAKILYGLMLDRMALSRKNNWFDEEHRVYIVFTVDEITELLGCGNQKAVRLLQELDGKTGIGLIEKKRLGFGKPNVIYVKNFEPLDQEEDEKKEEEPDTDIEEPCAKESEPFAGYPEEVGQGITDSDLEQQGIPYTSKKCENHTSRNVKTTLQEIPKSHFKKCENHTSRDVKITFQEFPKSHSNNTNINKTEKNKTEYSDNLSINLIKHDTDPTNDGSDGIDGYIAKIAANVDYVNIVHDYETGSQSMLRPELADEMIRIMAEAAALPDDEQVRVSNRVYRAGQIRKRFMKLRREHLEYVAECIAQTSRKVMIHNLPAYLLSALYNAPLTIGHYYENRVTYAENQGNWQI